VQELQSLCHKNSGAKAFRCLNLAKDELECIFSCIDADGPGDVSYAEFVDAVFKMKIADIGLMRMFNKSHLVQVQQAVTHLAGEIHQITIHQRQLVSDLATLKQEMKKQIHTFPAINSPRKGEEETVKIMDTQNRSFKQEGEGLAAMTLQTQELSHMRDGQVVKIATTDDLESMKERVLTDLADIRDQYMIQSRVLALASCNGEHSWFSCLSLSPCGWHPCGSHPCETQPCGLRSCKKYRNGPWQRETCLHRLC